MGIGFAIPLMGALPFAFFAGKRWLRRGKSANSSGVGATWSKEAARWKLHPVDGRAHRLAGRIGAHPIRASYRPRALRSQSILVEIDGLLEGLVVRARDEREPQGAMGALGEVLIGDPDFDRAFLVYGPERVARALLSAAVRRAFLASAEHVELTPPGTLLVSGAGSSSSALRTVLETAKALIDVAGEHMGDVEARLTSVASADPLDAVRLGATRALGAP